MSRRDAGGHVSRSPEPCHRLLRAFEGGHGLQMECLWEQVYQGESDGSIPGWLQRAEVPGEGGGGARDVNDLRRLNGCQAPGDVCAKPCTRRIDDDQCGTLCWRRLPDCFPANTRTKR